MGNIRIRLMSDLCSGNGESAGNAIDNDICTDTYGFPYIPGKRLLGCLRESAVLLKKYGMVEVTDDVIRDMFGDANGNEGKLCLGNAILPGIDSMHQYINSLKKDEKKAFLIRQSTEDKIIRGYTNVRGQTSIDQNGTAKTGSLRFIRVLNQYDTYTKQPIEFECDADTSRLSETQIKILENCCKSLRHIGMDRNRGLGNVWVTYNQAEKEVEKVEVKCNQTSNSEQICISYKVEFNSPISIQEYLEDGSQIKARTMIGVFSGVYLKNNEVDDTFNKLFLDGTVKWSALSPVIKGNESIPAPAMLMKLKNDNGKLINSFTEESSFAGKKPKSLDGFFMSRDEEGNCFIAQPEVDTTYHNRINGITGKDKEKKGLYIQDSLKQGMIYGGHVILPNDNSLIEVIKGLLGVGNIRIGRSKKVQYGLAKICDIEINDYSFAPFSAKEDETIFAILKSDLVLRDNTNIRLDNKFVRSKIAETLEIKDEMPVDEDGETKYRDICRYHVITGYNAMWNMQKPKIQTVQAGSVYCFRAKGKSYPSELVIGDYQQEGLGVIKIMSLEEMKGYSKIFSAGIDHKLSKFDENVVKNLENTLLYEAALDEIKEYGFNLYDTLVNKHIKYENDLKNERDWRKKRDLEAKEPLDLEKISSGRMRLMLQESKDLDDLWKKVESIKVSDISSENQLGKREHSKKLLMEVYGEGREVDILKMIKDENLKLALQTNEEVMNNVKMNWKEPLFTLIHKEHYRKSLNKQRNNSKKGGKRR